MWHKSFLSIQERTVNPESYTSKYILYIYLFKQGIPRWRKKEVCHKQIYPKNKVSSQNRWDDGEVSSQNRKEMLDS